MEEITIYCEEGLNLELSVHTDGTIKVNCGIAGDYISKEQAKQLGEWLIDQSEQNKAREEKYNKLKKAFEELNKKHANLKWASIREREITKNNWNIAAGLKEQ